MQAMSMPNDCSSRIRPGPAGRLVGGEGASHRGGIGLAVMDVPGNQEVGKFAARAGRPDVIPVEQHQLARTVGEHVVGVQVAMAGNQRFARLGGDQSGQFAQQADPLGQGRSPGRPVRESGVSDLIPGRRVWDGVVPGIGLAARRQCAGMQPAASGWPGGDACVGQVHRHSVNPPVEPQPAAAGIGGQPGDETPTRAGHAGRQPDASRFQVRGQLRLVARRFLVGVPEQLLDREAIRAQVKAPDLSHRTARYRDDRGVRYLRKPEGGADPPAVALPASITRSANQPTHGYRQRISAAPGGGGVRTPRVAGIVLRVIIVISLFRGGGTCAAGVARVIRETPGSCGRGDPVSGDDATGTTPSFPRRTMM